MSSVLSAWFYVLTLGIALLLLIAFVFIFFNPSLFLELTSASGQLVDLTGMDNFDPSSLSATAASAVIKVGANSYAIANNTTAAGVPNAFVTPGTIGITAATDVAGAKITGTFMFWLLMLGIGFLSLLLAFIAVKYPEKLFGPQVSALVHCLPKTKTSCSSSSSAFPPTTSVKPPVITSSLQPAATNTPINAGSNAAQITAALQQVAATPSAPKPVPQAPKPAATTTAPAAPVLTPAQLTVLQQFMAAMAAKSPPPA